MRPLLPSRPIVYLHAYRHFSKTATTMAEELSSDKPPRSKRPRLTHFLCIPLVNNVSLPQLEHSLAAFKASNPQAFPTNLVQNKNKQVEHQQLFPNDAIRPVGTLHLTLGVMSLPTPQRLDEAMRFFHSLDIVAILRSAEERALRNSKLRDDLLTDSASVDNSQGDFKPFNISLESLHAIPHPRAATVLHAAPVDLSHRLNPFCTMLRDKFVEAGFIQQEYLKREDKPSKKSERNQLSQAQAINSPAREGPTLLEEIPPAVAKETAQQAHPSVTAAPQPQQATEGNGWEIRPLYLHATIVNTIYARREKKARTKREHGYGRHKFDARNILSHYRSFYLDSDRTIPRLNNDVSINDHSKSTGNMGKSHDTVENSQGEGERRGSFVLPDQGKNRGATGYPFVWARDVPIETLQICEMGAKKIDFESDESGLNARLGQQYLAIAERSLISNFGK
ncbi:AKAP7 2'5' RNA ligase-like domain-containing protein [Aspergillus crustosus]